MKKLWSVGLAALMLAGAGCVFSRNAYVENSEFDLELPKRVLGGVRIGVFRNLSGSDRRFMVRRGDGQVVSLEYQRWRMSPDLMLQRCIYGALAIESEDAENVPRLNAVIYRFEFDERDHKAHLAVDFTFAAPGVGSPRPTVQVDVAVPVKQSGDLGAARAAAMSECARLAVAKLAAALGKK